MVVDYKVEVKGFEGMIKVSMPKYPERIRAYKALNFAFEKNEDGNMIVSMAGDNMARNAESFATMIEMSGKFVNEVNIKHESGKEYKSYDELLDDSRCDIICNELATFIFKGDTVGGN